MNYALIWCACKWTTAYRSLHVKSSHCFKQLQWMFSFSTTQILGSQIWQPDSEECRVSDLLRKNCFKWFAQHLAHSVATVGIESGSSGQCSTMIQSCLFLKSLISLISHLLFLQQMRWVSPRWQSSVHKSNSALEQDHSVYSMKQCPEQEIAWDHVIKDSHKAHMQGCWIKVT